MKRCILRAALLDRGGAVGVNDRVCDRTVLDNAAVDEQVLGSARRPLLRQRGDVAEQLDVAGVAANLDQVAPVAIQLIQPFPQRRYRRALQHLPSGTGEREADLRIAQRQLRDEPRDLRGLGPVRLEKLASRRKVVKEIGDLDRRAFRRPGFSNRRDGSAVDPDLGARIHLPGPRAHHEVRDRRDRREGFAPESERRDGRQIVSAADLARRVPLDGQACILRIHSLAIVVYPDQLLAAQLHDDRQPPRTRVNGVLDQLLDDGGRPLDDFAGGDLVSEIRWKTVDF